MTLYIALCTAAGANCFLKCMNKRRDVVSDGQPTLACVGINSGNVVHSNIVHTMGISEADQVFRHVPLAWISGPFLWILQLQ